MRVRRAVLKHYLWEGDSKTEFAVVASEFQSFRMIVSVIVED